MNFMVSLAVGTTVRTFMRLSFLPSARQTGFFKQVDCLYTVSIKTNILTNIDVVGNHFLIGAFHLDKFT